MSDDTKLGDVHGKPETVTELDIYEQIFRIFEEEFEEIGRFVAFTDTNAKTCSTKIHELHLRVCSEVENVLKIVIHRHFVPEGDIKKNWAAEKTKFLEKKAFAQNTKNLRKNLVLRTSKMWMAYYMAIPISHIIISWHAITFAQI
jgi:hypothetical protein